MNVESRTQDTVKGTKQKQRNENPERRIGVMKGKKKKPPFR